MRKKPPSGTDAVFTRGVPEEDRIGEWAHITDMAKSCQSFGRRAQI